MEVHTWNGRKRCEGMGMRSADPPAEGDTRHAVSAASAPSSALMIPAMRVCSCGSEWQQMDSSGQFGGRVVGGSVMGWEGG